MEESVTHADAAKIAEKFKSGYLYKVKEENSVKVGRRTDLSRVWDQSFWFQKASNICQNSQITYTCV